MLINIKLLLKRINLFLFPRRCVSCKTKDFWICKKCRENLEKTNASPEEFIYSIFNYKDKNIKRLIWFLKFSGKHSVLEDLKEIIQKEYEKFLHQNNLDEKDILVLPIPITKRSLKKRGYNQSEFIANILDRSKVKNNILYKSNNHISQNKIKNKNKRKENVKNSFKIKNINLVKNKTIILIDDVTTTGATMVEAKKILKSSGAKKVYGFTIAH
jgi:competence protein ComFC